ncbi:MAG: hypothetical protein N4A40_07020 [Tissierellales bacterium]|jgi:hypothetical protein|nr:hypothetical protein [Tissierellales bacterium]
MFYDYIYLDMDRISTYATKLGMRKPNSSKMMERTTNSTENSYTEGTTSGTQEVLKEYRDVETNETYFEDFEKKLENLKSQGYFVDLTDNVDEEVEIKSIKKQSIVKFESELLIPEEFGQADFIKTVLQNPYGNNVIWDSIDDADDVPKEFLNGLISEDRNVPLFFEVEDYKFYSSIKGNKLCNVSYSEFEENVGEEVTVLAKVEKVDNIDKEILLYDIYKDLLNMNRAMRRGMADGKSGGIPEKITINGKGIKLVILAVYK